MSVGIDGDCDFGVVGEDMHLGGCDGGSHDDGFAIPVEPDGDDTGRAIIPDVGQMRELGGGEQFLGDGVVEKCQVRHNYFPLTYNKCY